MERRRNSSVWRWMQQEDQSSLLGWDRERAWGQPGLHEILSQALQGSSHVLHIQVTVAAALCSPLLHLGWCSGDSWGPDALLWSSCRWLMKGTQIAPHHACSLRRYSRTDNKSQFCPASRVRVVTTFWTAWWWMPLLLSLSKNTQLQSWASRPVLSVLLYPNRFMFQILHFVWFCSNYFNVICLSFCEIL